jgi:hypothetical protein
MALSTNIPAASESPPRLIRLRFTLPKYRSVNVVTMDTGIERPTTIGLRMSRRKKNRTQNARPAPTSKDSFRPSNEALT